MLYKQSKFYTKSECQKCFKCSAEDKLYHVHLTDRESTPPQEIFVTDLVNDLTLKETLQEMPARVINIGSYIFRLYRVTSPIIICIYL